ncbi:putative peptidase [Gamsiella multidivaricata]|uniref:putative peptidase n=1 Tax=Gamsiella multidivaricata TaxID=101098 RepID=UPI00221E553D|nr:putative peptidase [Gamsiella multidivaricata]KAI7823847.1 putative peptidase [Gamsiella multidivaricata]
MTTKESAQELLEFHKGLVSISCITENESPCTEFLHKHLTQLGYTVELQKIAPGRENVLAYLGKGRNPTILFNTHIDVVPPYIEYREDEENVYGRGSSDAKGSMAAQVQAVEELRKEGKVKEGDIGFLFVVGEEVDHIGMVKANDLGLTPEYLIVGEPTESRLALGHKGVLRLNISIEGKAAHSGYPELGISANDKLIDLLYKLKNLDLPEDDYFGQTTLNIGMINGGLAANIVPAFATAGISFRIATSTQEVLDMVEKVIPKKQQLQDKITIERLTCWEPVRCHSVPGFETFVANYFTDIPSFLTAKHSLLYGPGSILCAHAPHEYINKKELIAAVGSYKDIVLKLFAEHKQ